MTRLFFAIAFLLGLCAILWMGASFVGSDPLALTVTAMIAAVYVLGIVELLQFRRTTASLSQALSALPQNGQQAESLPLEPWLDCLPPSLRNAVRARIEGERVGLPAPVFTPYLVGLLVMLGLLGTFVGMVETLGGAVVALQGSAELEAIRAGLAAPIKGLGLAFGTSVAGVATSAMLGLNSTLCRRERMEATRHLDDLAADAFREYSPSYTRQETFRVLQSQADSLPAVVTSMEAMADKLNRMAEALTANQEQFHAATSAHYGELARSVDQSLRESLADSGKLAGESIRPVVAQAMEDIAGKFESISSAALEKLRTEEEQRSTAAAQRLVSLESTVATHLADLGRALEEPMTRLIETASEAPRAAAEVIGQLRQEVSLSIERDNGLLEERQRIMADLDTLAGSLQESSTGQREAVEQLVASSTDMLTNLGDRFTDHASSEVSRMSGIAAEFAGSATEMSSLGEAFTVAVDLFSASNEKLIENLERIEVSLDQSSSRSDEQMGYYVSQAREIIDHSMSSQKEIIEELRRLGSQQDLFPAEAG